MFRMYQLWLTRSGSPASGVAATGLSLETVGVGSRRATQFTTSRPTAQPASATRIYQQRLMPAMPAPVCHRCDGAPGVSPKSSGA